jgi:hypothetical protein
MTKLGVLVVAPSLALFVGSCSIGEPIQLSTCGSSDPGPNCPPTETCTGECVVIPPFGGWELGALLWFGPALEAPVCPADRAPMVGYEGVADPPEPPVCAACTCEPPAGECGLPSVLSASTDTMCPDDDPAAAHTNFSGLSRPGLCNNDNSVAAGQGLVVVEPLTLTETKCKPGGPPPPNDGEPTWRTFARACRGNTSACLDPSLVCVPAVPPPPPGFLQCIYREGDRVCPDEYPNRHVFYDEISGSRECSTCGCAPPEGGVCSAKVELFEDGLCTISITDGVVSSSAPACIGYIPQVSPLGGKKVTDLSYEPGVCEPTGGEPIDSVELKGPSTFCCQ